VNLWDSGKFLVSRHYYPPFGCAAVRSDDMMIHQSGGRLLKKDYSRRFFYALFSGEEY
jgi:hypothetical protein